MCVSLTPTFIPQRGILATETPTMIQVPEFLTVQNIGGLCLHSLAGICSFGVRKEKKKNNGNRVKTGLGQQKHGRTGLELSRSIEIMYLNISLINRNSYPCSPLKNSKQVHLTERKN